ncbi:lipopolysaccharide heptosyltransferase family protein [bacterium]|nr:lipopolysaccharide heptosyltransferase family protein [bacterium]
MNQSTPYKKILVQRADKLGDVVFTLPVIDWLRFKFPDAEIHFITSVIPAELIMFQRSINRVISLKHPIRIIDIYRLGRQLKSEKYDLYLSLWNDPKMAWLGQIIGIPNRIGDATNLSLKWLYTATVRQPWENLRIHQIEFNMMLLAPLGWDGKWKWAIDIDPDSRHSIMDKLNSVRQEGQSIVTVVCGSGGSNLPIPHHVVRSTAEVLSETALVVLVGQVDDELLTGFSLDGVLNLLNATSLKELVAWLSLSDVVVGADTGPIHIAAALNKKIVFCPIIKSNFPTRFGPWGKSVEIIRTDFLCETHPPKMCIDRYCRALPDDITIIEATDRLLENDIDQRRSEIRRLFFMRSIHILVVVPTPVQHHAMQRLSSRWKNHGMILIPILCVRPSAFRLAKMASRYNCTVVFAPNVSIATMKRARLIAGIVYQYIRPIYAKMPLSVNEDLDEVVGLVSDWMDSKVGVVA